MTEEDDHKRAADEHVARWSQGKEHFDKVRNLMGFLAHAELLGAHHGRPTETGFIKGPRPEDWDLDSLYAAALHAHPQTRKKMLKQAQEAAISAAAAKQAQQPGRESVRDSISRAMGKPVERPQRESVRDSIRKAMGKG